MDYQETPYQVCFNIEELSLKQKLTSSTAECLELNPQFVLGSSSLFNYDPQTKTLSLSPYFYELLRLLVSINELDPAALKAKSLEELNAILQKPQGLYGGFLRKEGSERWHLEDSSLKKEHKKDFDLLFEKLGFVKEKPYTENLKAHHVLIFGATALRMDIRIQDMIARLKSHLDIENHLFFFGSNRKLTSFEHEFLQDKIKSTNDPYWTGLFSESDKAVESDAIAFLWDFHLDKNLQEAFKDKCIQVRSSRIGPSYNHTEGHRPTTEVTIEDWLALCENTPPKVIFSSIEQPYIRMLDQYYTLMISQKKTASLKEIKERLANVTFDYAVFSPPNPPLTSVVLDEIARHVYCINGTINYLDNLK